MREVVFLDALGTILWMDAPWNHAPPELVAGLPRDRIEAAFGAEIAYYRAHIANGDNAAGLADLRQRCADVLSRGLGLEVSVEQMMSTLRFEPFAETKAALAAIGDRGVLMACVSNWDCSLDLVLADLGLAESFELVVTSASAGVSKPDPAIFAYALKQLGCDAGSALHVGDSDADVAAARAAGVDVLRIDRSGGADIHSLTEIVDHL